MEFLRFGSSIPGSYWGCCACDIIQNFKCDPKAPYSIEIINGDGGQPMMIGNESAFVGMTYEEVFNHRIRFGTFSMTDMPNHGFLAILTDWQISSGYGKEWLEILKKHGFEFIRTIDHSVYTGSAVLSTPEAPSGRSSKPNYLFGLFRNIGTGSIVDPYQPPKAWKDLDSVTPEVWELLGDTKPLADKQREAQLPLWKALPAAKFYKRSEIEAAGVPVTLGGQRSLLKQQSPAQRESAIETLRAQYGKPKSSPKEAVATPFAVDA